MYIFFHCYIQPHTIKFFNILRFVNRFPIFLLYMDLLVLCISYPMFSSPNSNIIPTFFFLPQIGGGSLFLWTPLAAPTCLPGTERYFHTEKTTVVWLHIFELNRLHILSLLKSFFPP